MGTSTIARYLECYSEPIVAWFERAFLERFNRTYQFVLVIPVFAEPLDCLETVLPANLDRTLAIVVVNSAVNSDPSAIARSQAFLARFHHSRQPVSLFNLFRDSDCLIVDFTSAGRQFPAKQGVGLARKIGGGFSPLMHSQRNCRLQLDSLYGCRCQATCELF